MRKLSTDKLIFVKNELIIPGYLSFYELIETYGGALLFLISVHSATDVRTGPHHEGPLAFWDNDSNVKHHFNIRTPSFASALALKSSAKVMERKLYDKNKHIYPYTLWEPFDEIKQKEYLEEVKRKEKEKPAPSLLS